MVEAVYDCFLYRLIIMSGTNAMFILGVENTHETYERLRFNLPAVSMAHNRVPEMINLEVIILIRGGDGKVLFAPVGFCKGIEILIVSMEILRNPGPGIHPLLLPGIVDGINKPILNRSMGVMPVEVSAALVSSEKNEHMNDRYCSN